MSKEPHLVSTDASPTLLVHELYASIQGESTHAGRPCAFVRLTGCPLRCVWCDSEHAFTGGERLTVGEVLARVAALGLNLVEVTGGEPLAQPGCIELLRTLCDAGHEVLLETSGAFDLTPVDARVKKIVDIKCPGSGEAERNRWENLTLLGAQDELKFVLADAADYAFACDVLARHAPRVGAIHFSPVYAGLTPAELAAWVLRDAPATAAPIRVQLQLHKLIWPDRQRGI